MANNFFSRFPTIDYNMDGRGSLLTLTDITKSVDVNDIYANNATYYTYHDIQDGERPDTVSYRLYSNPNYYWTFFIINNELRTGLNNSWPLSLNALERMIADEYDPYCAITFAPVSDLITGIGNSGLAQLIHMNESYLPYLRLRDENSSAQAKLLRYDNSMLQMVVSEVSNASGNGQPMSLDPFLSSSYFTLVWVNPFDVLTETEQYNECEAARLLFISDTISVYSEFDSSAIPDPSLYDSLPSQAEIDAAIADYRADYVFGKQYFPAKKYSPARNLVWNSYRDAPATYYFITEEGNVSASAYDVITDPNIIVPNYISNAEKESIINSRKEKIRVIRPDRIAAFVSSYFSTLNS